MPIPQADLEAAIRNAMPITHLQIIDQSNGCGENYAIFVVSDAFEGMKTLARHRFGECISPSFQTSPMCNLFM